jgi:hypothetical protein
LFGIANSAHGVDPHTTGSARISKELRTLDSTPTRRWPTFAGTAEFHEALAA